MWPEPSIVADAIYKIDENAALTSSCVTMFKQSNELKIEIQICNAGCECSDASPISTLQVAELSMFVWKHVVEMFVDPAFLSLSACLCVWLLCVCLSEEHSDFTKQLHPSIAQ